MFITEWCFPFSHSQAVHLSRLMCTQNQAEIPSPGTAVPTMCEKSPTRCSLRGRKIPVLNRGKLCCMWRDRSCRLLCLLGCVCHTNREQPPQLLHVAPGCTENSLYSETGKPKVHSSQQVNTMTALAVDFYLTQHLGIYYLIYYCTLRKRFLASPLSAWFPQIHESIYPWIRSVCRSVKQLFFNITS